MTNPDREGPYVGSRCLADNGGSSELSKVKRVNEDGTFNVEAVDSGRFFLTVTYGMTAAELIFNDRDLWGECFARVSSDSKTLSIDDFDRALQVAQRYAPRDKVETFWNDHCTQKLHLEKPADARLDSDAAYDLFVAAGMSATKFLQGDAAFEMPEYVGAYYNSIRLAGRDPSEVKRKVTLQDALEAWGVDGREPDKERTQALDELEHQSKVALPPPLRDFLCRDRIDDVIAEHPLAPWLFPLEDLSLRKAAIGLDGQYALGVLRREELHYYGVFNAGDADARIYMLNTERVYYKRDENGRYRPDEDIDEDVYNDDDKAYECAAKKPEAWQLTAPTVGMFFWDLGQTSLIWYQDNYENIQFEKTDIGLKSSEAAMKEIARQSERR